MEWGPKHTSVFCLRLPILYLYALSDPCGAPTKIPWVRSSLRIWQVRSRSLNYTLKCTFIRNVNMCSCCWLLEFYRLISQHYRSQLPHGLRHGSADARLLGLRVPIPPGACVSMCYHVGVSAKGRSLLQRGPTECGVSECDSETSPVRRPRPTRVVEPWTKIPGLRDLRLSQWWCSRWMLHHVDW